MKKSRNIVAVLASVLILFTALLPFQALAAADGLSVSVSYEAKCNALSYSVWQFAKHWAATSSAIDSIDGYSGSFSTTLTISLFVAIGYLYFGLNDTIMSMVHSDHIPNSSYLSDSLENNYLIRSGEIHQWSDSLEESIQKNLNSGNTTFEIPIESSMPMAYQNVIYSIAAYQLSSQKWTTETHTVKLTKDFRIVCYLAYRCPFIVKQILNFITACICNLIKGQGSSFWWNTEFG